jgi:hypothetical protein
MYPFGLGAMCHVSAETSFDTFATSAVPQSGALRKIAVFYCHQCKHAETITEKHARSIASRLLPGIIAAQLLQK